MSDKTWLTKGPKQPYVKTRTITRSMTTATLVAAIPKGSRILKLILSGTASDAGTTAVLSIGTTTTATELVSSQSVLAAGAGNGVNLLKGVTGAVGSVYQSDTQIYVLYAETGGASTVGSWVLEIWYTTGNITNDETL